MSAALAVVLMLGVIIAGCARSQSKAGPKVMRVGYFPNITHSQAVIGVARGDFAKSLGSRVRLEPTVFNGGPSVIEALFAGRLDLAYIGPNPAINGYIKSDGRALRVVAGATSGGAVLVARKDSNIRRPENLAGKKLATPQLGNTQDVALRYYIRQSGLKTTEQGGSVEVLPQENPDILTSFLSRRIDGAWVPEPWGARLVREGNGRVLLDERDLWPGGRFTTAVVIARTDFLKENPELVRKWLRTHIELTQWITDNPERAKQLVNQGIKKLTDKDLPGPVLDDAFSRLEVTYDPLPKTILTAADHAFELGFLGNTKPDLKSLVDVDPLNEVLKDLGRPAIEVEVN